MDRFDRFTPFIDSAEHWDPPHPTHSFLNCDGPGFHPDWKSFHEKFIASPDKALSDMMNEAQWLTWKWQETADRMCLDYNDHDWFVRYHPSYLEEHISDLEKLLAVRVFTGNLEPEALEGFCPLGFATVASLVAEAHLRILGERLLGLPFREEASVPMQQHVYKAITFLRLALKCLGPQLSMDFLESSWWPLRTLDVRILLAALEPVDWWSHDEPSLRSAYEWIPRSFTIWAADFLSPWALPAAFRLETFLPRRSGYMVGPAVRGRQALRLRIAVFGQHGSLMAEPAFTIREAFGKPPVGSEVVQSRFFGMGWPSKFRCRVLMSCKSDNPRIDKWMSNYTSYLDDGFRWSVDAERSAVEFLAQELRRDRFLRRADLLVCTLARLCPMLRKAAADPNLPMFMYFSMSLTWSSDSAEQDRRILLDLQRMLTSERMTSDGRPRYFGAVTSHFWATQALFQTGLTMPVLRPLAKYVGNVTYTGFSKPGNLNILLARSRIWVGTAHGTAFLKMLDFFVPNMVPFNIIPQGHDWIDYDYVAMFRCVLLLPHHPVSMALYDYYALGIPIIVPSKRYMCRMLQLRGHTFTVRDRLDSIDVSVADAGLVESFPYSPMPQGVDDVRHAAFLVELMSYYNLPHVATFDSFQGFRDAAVDSDKLRSDRMVLEQRRHHATLTDVYRKQVLTLLPEPERRAAK